MVAVGSALLVVTTSIVHAALWLVVTLGALAGCFLVLTAEFVAWVQVLIYVGAVVVLLLFGLMLTRAPIGPSVELTRRHSRVALVVAVATAGVLVSRVVGGFRMTCASTSTRRAWVTGGRPASALPRWVLPFEVLSVLLLAALVGAIVLSRRPSGEDQRDGSRRCSSRLPLVVAALLFSIGVYGVLARRNAILVLMSVELMLNAVNLNLVAFDVYLRDALHAGQVLTLFVITIAAAEIGLGLAIVLLVFRNRGTSDLDALDSLDEVAEDRAAEQVP